MRIACVFAASLTLLVVAHSAAAPITEKQAIAQVKASTKANLKLFKQAGATALSDLAAALDTFDGALTPQTTPGDAAAAVADAATAFLDAVNAAQATAVSSVVNDAETALQSLVDGADLHGVYPPEFNFGTGGVLDDSRAVMDKEAGLLRTAALKRLAKSLAKAEKSADLAFALHLRLPTRDLANEFDEFGGFGNLQAATLDLVLTVSSLDGADDGVLVVSGLADGGDDVTIDRQHELDDVQQTVACSNGRFEATYTGVTEGGYLVGANQNGALDSSTDTINVR